MNPQQRTDAMRRCHYVNPTDGETCNAAPQIGKNFCFFHDPEKREQHAEACREGGRNRRQPEPPPRIPPNLPYVKLETRTHIQLVYEVTMNYVLQGQMDLRVANTIGYLALGALATLDSQARADRQAALDAERAAEKPRKAKEKAEKEAAHHAPSSDAFEHRDKHGRKHRFPNGIELHSPAPPPEKQEPGKQDLGKPEKDKRDRYTATETGPPEIRTF